jgi:hypothetical protein
MKGYIYTMSAGADPGHGWVMTDPIFGRIPTLGACVPNIRRAVVPGDYIFVVSGRIPGVQQFVVGGFQVDEKIDALTAYKRFPENRMKIGREGLIEGNIIVDQAGKHHPLDEHDGFAARVENYIVGHNATAFAGKSEYEAAREETLDVLGDIFHRTGNRAFDIIGRHRKMDERQIGTLLEWINSVKS